MGQKINPISNRLGIIRGWDSNWFGGKNFGDTLLEDTKIRKYLNARLANASVSRIVIERTWKLTTITICSSHPGVIIGKGGQEVEYEHMLVDNCAMQLVKDPKQFDVILTENMFGDILSDEASMVTGSIGMLSSASLNDTKFGLYEPSGGSAPDIAGKGIANPIATILSAAMMLRYTFDLDKEADAIEAAVKKVLKEGYRTIDIMPQAGESTDGITQVGTAQMGDLIAQYV